MHTNVLNEPGYLEAKPQKAIDQWKPSDHLHIERVEGGFLINGYAVGKTIRAVAHNETKLVSTLRKWLGAGDLAAESEAAK